MVKVGGIDQANHSLEQPIRRFGGAYASRIIDAPGNEVREHAHDWPVLSVFIAGAVHNHTECGVRELASPWVVLYGPGAAHANRVGANGFEQVQIEFDPAWLVRDPSLKMDGPRHWIGGEVCSQARRLVDAWSMRDAEECRLASATKEFLRRSLTIDPPRTPPWVERVTSRLRKHPQTSTAEIARALRLNPNWLAQAYRAAVGEGLRETRRRLRVEQASTLLRTSGLSAAAIAAHTGFCDQGHMIRSFGHVLGRTPQAVRDELRGAKGA